MSKLAHSNAATMEEIEMQARGLKPMPAPPRCSAKTPKMWFRPSGGTCSFAARWKDSNEKFFCTKHAWLLEVVNGY